MPVAVLCNVDGRRLFVLLVFYIPGWCVSVSVSATPVTDLQCPDRFVNGGINTITYVIDSAGIVRAGCTFASNVVFSFLANGSSTGRDLCSQSYPPDTCNADIPDGECGCIQQDENSFTYEYRFPVEESHRGGAVYCMLCATPSGPFDPKVSPSCNSVTFGEYSCYDSSMFVLVFAGIRVTCRLCLHCR